MIHDYLTVVQRLTVELQQYLCAIFIEYSLVQNLDRSLVQKYTTSTRAKKLVGRFLKFVLTCFNKVISVHLLGNFQRSCQCCQTVAAHFLFLIRMEICMWDNKLQV